MRIIAFTISVALTCSATSLSAGVMKNACMKSDRNPSRATCQCIQQVADQRLTASDQKLASKFFADPHMSQEVRQSDNRAKEKFWLRYKAFGEVAGKQCG